MISSWVASESLARHDGHSPVVVLLHGYGSNERDLPSLMPYLEPDLPWVSLRAPVDMSLAGFAWFPLTEALNPTAADVASPTDDIWAWLDERVGSTTPITAIGFSQGGLMASQLVRTRPERIRDTVIMSGFVAEATQPGDSILAELKPDVLWVRGAVDPVITDEAVGRARVFFTEHATLDERVYPDLGHSVDERVLRDIRSHLARR